ncbi:MAG: c-type cytochrome, partial [Planctomycetes bacterium]|nr:c-type cytochrome [Planctomycetota bacterium]
MPAQHPGPSGFSVLRDGSVPVAERGELLWRELACAACHDDPRTATRRAPRLDDIGARVNPAWLRRFLDDPRATRPGSPMPRPAPGTVDAERGLLIEDLVRYLVSRGGPMPEPKSTASAPSVVAGQQLFDRIGCAACHPPSDGRATDGPSVEFGDLAGKWSADALVAFLRDPFETRPAGRMPHFDLTPPEAHDLAMFLLRGQIDNPATADRPLTRPGLRYEYFEAQLDRLRDGALDDLEPSASGFAEGVGLDVPCDVREDYVALRFTGHLVVPLDGDYEFFLSSDDGSMLWIDGRLVVDHDGLHAPSTESAKLRLTSGSHEIRIEWFEYGGGEQLELGWSGPEFGRRPVP